MRYAGFEVARSTASMQASNDIGCPHGAGQGEPVEDLAGVDFPQSILLGVRRALSGEGSRSGVWS